MTKRHAGTVPEHFSKTCSSIISGVISFFLLILATVFPLVYDNSYINILPTKYKCYYLSIIGMMIILLALSSAMLTVDIIEFKGAHTRALFATLSPQKWKTAFHVADAAVFVFWLTALVSTLQSDYRFESFWGNCRMGICRYLVMTASFFTVVLCIGFINRRYSGTVLGLDSLFQVLVHLKWLPVAAALLWGAAISLICFRYKKPLKHDTLGNRLVCIWAAAAVTAVLGICFALYDVNAGGNAGRYGTVGRYLLFNGQWGTNRGYIWRKSLELYRDFPVMHKIFGYGPDTFGILTTNTIRFEMMNATGGQVFDNAHNAYLQYLVTVGPIGLVAYVVFLVSAISHCRKYMPQNPYLIGCAFAVICYVVQALVNLDLPIATPMMWMLLSVGMAHSSIRNPKPRLLL